MSEIRAIPLPPLDPSRLAKPVVVVTVVIIGFLVGVPPAMMAALGAAALPITRTTEPRKLYDEVDWGLLVFFVGLFLIVGGAENAGIVARLLTVARHWNLQRLDVFTLVVTLFSNLVSNVPAMMLLKSLVPGFTDPAHGMAGAHHGQHPGGQSDHHGLGGQHHRGRDGEARRSHRILGLFPRWLSHHLTLLFYLGWFGLRSYAKLAQRGGSAALIS